MNIRRVVWIGLVMFGSVLRAAEPDIEFAGIISAEGKVRIALTDKAKKSTTWVEPGEQFLGYTVARYDEKEEAVFLKKGLQEIRLGLVASKTTDARPATGETSSASTEAMTTAVRSNLRQLASAAHQFRTEHNAATVGFNDLVGPGKPIKELKPVAGENYSTLNFGPNVTAVSVTTSTGVTVSLDLPPANAATPASKPASPLPTVRTR